MRWFLEKILSIEIEFQEYLPGYGYYGHCNNRFVSVKWVADGFKRRYEDYRFLIKRYINEP
jgi:hypothetical protein